MPPHRPRASDFDEPSRERGRSPTRSPSPPPSSSHHDRYHERHHRRPSPNYDRGNHLEQQQRHQRLTPEESLDHYTRNHPKNSSYDQEHPITHEPPSRYPRPTNNYSNGYRQGGRDDFFESRRLQRESAQVQFWPESPLQAYGEGKRKKSSSSHRHDEDHTSHHKSKDHKKHKKSSHHSHHKSKSSKKSKRRHRSSSSDSDSDSDSDRSERGHRRHHHHRSHKSSKRKSTRDRKRSRAEEDDESDDSEESSDDEHEERKHNKRREGTIELDEEDDWVETDIQGPTRSSDPTTTTAKVARKESITGPTRPAKVEEPPPPAAASIHPPNELLDETQVDDDDAAEVGPMPYNHVTGKAMDPKEFGRALRPGEGSAMAAFIEAGERIPRRGEIGLTGHEIEKFENVGYVMSGSRHRRMNAVRIRKENQVISAEEKRGILKMQAEEKAKREGQIISSFRELVDTKLQETAN